MSNRWRILLALVLLAATMLACSGCWMGDACSNWWQASYNATATYGAEQLHIQLTEMAK